MFNFLSIAGACAALGDAVRADLARAGSPLALVEPGAPPFLILHGTKRMRSSRSREASNSSPR